jgi:hypothetical protein
MHTFRVRYDENERSIIASRIETSYSQHILNTVNFFGCLKNTLKFLISKKQFHNLIHGKIFTFPASKEQVCADLCNPVFELLM